MKGKGFAKACEAAGSFRLRNDPHGTERDLFQTFNVIMKKVLVLRLLALARGAAPTHPSSSRSTCTHSPLLWLAEEPRGEG